MKGNVLNNIFIKNELNRLACSGSLVGRAFKLENTVSGLNSYWHFLLNVTKKNHIIHSGSQWQPCHWRIYFQNIEFQISPCTIILVERHNKIIEININFGLQWQPKSKQYLTQKYNCIFIRSAPSFYLRHFGLQWQSSQ